MNDLLTQLLGIVNQFLNQEVDLNDLAGRVRQIQAQEQALSAELARIAAEEKILHEQKSQLLADIRRRESADSARTHSVNSALPVAD